MKIAIAIHPKTPPHTIEKLAKDGNVYVNGALLNENYINRPNYLINLYPSLIP